MCKNSDRRKPIFDSCPMDMYINAISQSANNENVRELLCKVTDKTFAKVAPIVCAFASTHYADCLAWIECSVTFII